MKNILLLVTDLANSDLNTLLMSIVIIMLIFKFIDKTINGNDNDRRK